MIFHAKHQNHKTSFRFTIWTIFLLHCFFLVLKFNQTSPGLSPKTWVANVSTQLLKNTLDRWKRGLAIGIQAVESPPPRKKHQIPDVSSVANGKTKGPKFEVSPFLPLVQFGARRGSWRVPWTPNNRRFFHSFPSMFTKKKHGNHGLVTPTP